MEPSMEPYMEARGEKASMEASSSVYKTRALSRPRLRRGRERARVL